MASSSATRWRLGCDACGVSAWVGPSAGASGAWCESCQTAASLPAAPVPGDRCDRCSAPRSAEPRFVELWGLLQHLDAVLGAWAGDPGALGAILPERPRLLTDLTPPGLTPGDPDNRVAALRALARGDWHAVLTADADADPRALAARAIAAERTGDPGSAIAHWSAVLAAGGDARARLARAALLARAGRYDEALTDLALAGAGFEARWDRAAVYVMRAVVAWEGMPGEDTLELARSEAGEASPYWSDPTVGRLLWTLLVERALVARSRPEVAGVSAATPLEDVTRESLRAAEWQFEHSTFWDRALVVLGWARLGETGEVSRVAAPLARELAASLLDEPALAGERLAEVSSGVAAARSAMDLGDPVEARRFIAAALARDDLKRFRIPCAACGRGTVGIEEVEDVEAGA